MATALALAAVVATALALAAVVIVAAAVALVGMIHVAVVAVEALAGTIPEEGVDRRRRGAVAVEDPAGTTPVIADDAMEQIRAVVVTEVAAKVGEMILVLEMVVAALVGIEDKNECSRDTSRQWRLLRPLESSAIFEMFTRHPTELPETSRRIESACAVFASGDCRLVAVSQV